MMPAKLCVIKMAECTMAGGSQLNGLARMTVMRGELPEDPGQGVHAEEAQADREDAAGAEASGETEVETDMAHLPDKGAGAGIATLQTEDPCHGHQRETDTDLEAGHREDIRIMYQLCIKCKLC